MNSRTLFSGVGLLLVAVVLILGLALINNIGGTLRLDLTENKLYSLSEGSQNIVKTAQEPITLTLFFSEKLSKDSPQIRDYAKRVRELVEEYALLSNGMIDLNIVDPEPFSEDEDSATAFGLQGYPTGNGDKFYFGLVAISESMETKVLHQEVIPFFQLDKEQFLEYDISKLIYKVTHPDAVTVGLLSELDLAGGYDVMTRQRKPEWMIMGQIKQLFEVEVIKSDVMEIADNIDVLMVVHPKMLPMKTLYAIDQYVLRGGKALIFVDPSAELDMGEQGMMAANTEKYSDLEQLFKAWGVDYSFEQIIGDGRFAMHVTLGQDRRTEPHLGVLSLDPDALSRDDVLTSQLESINISSSGIISAAEGATTIFTPLITSSNNAMLYDRADYQMLKEPRKLFDKFKPTGEYYVMAARVQGPAETAFPDGSPVIAEVTEGGEQEGGAIDVEKASAELSGAETPEDTGVAQIKSSDNINVIVVADTDILSDRLWVQIQDFFGQRMAQPWANNATFVVNSLDNLSGSADLIKVRSRGKFSRPFTVVDELERQAEQRFREQERNLMMALEETEMKLQSLSSSSDGQEEFVLTDAQKNEIANFENEKISIRKKLRDVQHQLNKDIDELGQQLKIINIGAVPLFLTLMALLLSFVRKSKRKTV